jgi:hypothetical protein
MLGTNNATPNANDPAKAPTNTRTNLRHPAATLAAADGQARPGAGDRSSRWTDALKEDPKIDVVDRSPNGRTVETDARAADPRSRSRSGGGGSTTSGCVEATASKHCCPSAASATSNSSRSSAESAAATSNLKSGSSSTISTRIGGSSARALNAMHPFRPDAAPGSRSR